MSIFKKLRAKLGGERELFKQLKSYKNQILNTQAQLKFGHITTLDNKALPSILKLLIELSSPLAGYLGRVEENGKKVDRFYFLRDLPIEKES